MNKKEQQLINKVLDEVETFFLDKKLSSYRFEISKKAWTKLRKKYEL